MAIRTLNAGGDIKTFLESSSNAPGDELIINSGVYEHSSAITVSSSGLNIHSAPGALVMIRSNAVRLRLGGANCIWDGFIMEGGNLSEFQMTGNNHTIINNVFQNPLPNSGIKAYVGSGGVPLTNSVIRNNWFRNIGLPRWNSAHTSYNIYEHPLYVQSSSNFVTIEQNRFSNIMGYCVHMYDPGGNVHDIMIRDNRAWNTYFFVASEGADGPNIRVERNASVWLLGNEGQKPSDLPATSSWPIQAPNGRTFAEGQATLLNNVFFSNATGYGVDGTSEGGLSGTATTLAVNPQFRDPANGDFTIMDASAATKVGAPPPPPPIPNAPTNLGVTRFNDSVIATWQDNATNETAYVIEMGSNSTFTSNFDDALLVPGSTQYVDTEIDYDKTNYYRVKAVNSSGSSNWSNTASLFIASPTTAALAIPRGGVAAAVIPATARFGQAADLYDSVGMNVHVHSTPNTTYLNGTALCALLSDMGVRHFRMGLMDALYSWKGSQNQHMTNAVIAHNNAALTNGKQPLWWDAIMTSPGSNPPAANVYDFPDSYDNDPGAPPPPNYYKSPSYGRYSDDDGIAWSGYSVARILQGIERSGSNIPWQIIGSMMGFNEPDLGYASYSGPWSGHVLKNNWERPMLQALRARTSTPAFTGHSFVTTEGIQTSGGKVSQIPKIGASIIGYTMANMLGDMTATYNDLGDRHPYVGMGKEPSDEQFAADERDTWNYRAQYFGGTPLPLHTSEFGHVSNGLAPDLGGHAGYWPSPNDVIAEYCVRVILKGWSLGVRRIHFYEFLDEGTDVTAVEQMFGFVTFGGVKKPQFFAIKNLLSLIGFSEAPTAQKAPLAYSLSGFTAGAANIHTAMFQGTSPGQPAPGQPFWQSADKLDSLQVQKDANNWVIFLLRNKSLWERERGNWSTNVPGTGSPSRFGNIANGRKAEPTPQNITITLPSNVVSAQWAQPAWNTSADPYMQVTTANEAEGRTWRNLTVNTVGSNKTVVVPITDHVKAIKVTTSSASLPLPATPTSLTVNAGVDATGPYLSCDWANNVPAPFAYTVMINGVEIDNVGQSDFIYRDVEEGESYTVQVRAVNTTGPSPYTSASDPAATEVIPSTISNPTAPINVQVVASYPNTGPRNTITWGHNSPVGAVRFLVYQYPISTPLTTTTSFSYIHEPSSLVPGQQYCYYVVAENTTPDALKSVNSNVQCVLAKGGPNSLRLATMINSPGEPPKATIAWNDNSNNEVNFILQRDTEPDFTSAVSFIILPDVESYLDEDLEYNTRYFYRIRGTKPTESW